MCAQKIEWEMFLYGAEDNRPATQNGVHSQQREQETVFTRFPLSFSLPLPCLFSPMIQDCHLGTLVCQSTRISSFTRFVLTAASGVSGSRWAHIDQ